MKTIQTVDSSQLHKVGYDTETQTLTIEFKNHKVYEYYEVSADVFKALIESDSIGSYFINNIKHKYKYKLVG